MPLLGSKNKKKTSPGTLRPSSSATTTSTTSTNNKTNNNTTIYPHQSNLLSRLPINASTPTVYHQHQYNTNLSNRTTPSLSDYSQQQQQQLISPFDSPTPTPSTSWTSEMSAFVDKLRDDAAAMVASNKYQPQQPTQTPLDRKSVSQGMKLVAIAADEYEDGNDAVALDIYLSGIDKILMALPNKTDPRTKIALREKLISVEERVGILNLAIQYKRLPNIQSNDHDDSNQYLDNNDDTIMISGHTGATTTTTKTSVFSSISTTISTISSIGSTTVQAWEENNASMQLLDQQDPIHRFKRFGRFVINTSVCLAIMVKRSPVPDLIGLICSYLVHVLSYLDHQYQVRQKMQSVGIECIKLLLAADEHYHLHELASETLYMLIAASLKAAVAFKESPSYRHPTSSPASSSPSSDSSSDGKDISQIEYQDSPSPPPPSTSGSRLPWILSGWY
ncbi:uncharacterized protein BX664DRAFT_385954 [Halteromyces radiatus]|uniref:uncharacterized protein n=1 Tax=Halteromyces radiatus TaxID=101107 RepID=UPI00221EB84C|nr:uncharacterized protein BX664DRAFT_385954 [Halteromyces radiatus]KAI8089471.1 hypothetical protein BX664DRAFT_385954 [Halteromyces radiatus]